MKTSSGKIVAQELFASRLLASWPAGVYIRGIVRPIAAAGSNIFVSKVQGLKLSKGLI
jgi:hypothetical protein